MHILLLGINARYSHSNLALKYLRTEIRAEGHEPVTLEFEINQRRQDILERVVAVDPEVVFLSVYVWNALLVSLLLPDLHALLPDASIYLGGPEVSWSADHWLNRHPEITAVICGAGEQAVRTLAHNGFRTESRIISVENRPFVDIPFPYEGSDLAGLAYRYVYYESSRGCPCSCAYCVSGRGDQRPDFRDPRTTMKELAFIIEQTKAFPSPPIVKLVDRTFNARPDRAREIWRFLIAADTAATFHFEIHPAFLQDADFAVLAEAPKGRFQFEIGVQSVQHDTLRAVGRSNQWARSRQRVEQVLAFGTIAVHLDLIVGLPYDDIGSLGAAIDDLLELKPHRLDIGMLKSLPGTEIRARAAEYRQIAMRDPPYQVLANAWLTPADFALFTRVEALVDAVWNANRLETELEALATRYGGCFEALRALERHATETGYNLATRQSHKVETFLQSAICSHSR